MRFVVAVAAAVLISQASWGQAHKKAPARSQAGASQSKAAPPAKQAGKAPAKAAASRTPASASAKKGAKTKGKTPAWRSVQNQPTPERYKEIQEALASKGYFTGTPDGNWGPDSVEALKRFQEAQSLESDGKIGSLSLIALGLGPKRVPATAQPASDGSPNAPASR